MDAKTFKEFRSHEWNIGVVSYFVAILLFHFGSSSRMFYVIYTAIKSLFAANAAFELRTAKRFSSSDNSASAIAFRESKDTTMFPLLFIFPKREKKITKNIQSFSQINKKVLQEQLQCSILINYLSLFFILHLLVFVFVFFFGYIIEK